MPGVFSADAGRARGELMPITFSFGDGTIANRRSAPMQPARRAAVAQSSARTRSQELRDLERCARIIASRMHGVLPIYSDRIRADLYNLAMQKRCWGLSDPRIAWEIGAGES